MEFWLILHKFQHHGLGRSSAAQQVAMKKLAIITLTILAVSFPANAYTTHKVTPVVVKGVTVVWEYEFYFTKPPSAEHGSVFIEVYSCASPINHRTGQPLLPHYKGCVNSKAEADVEAGKEAGLFEYQCRHSKECDLDKIGARHKKNVAPPVVAVPPIVAKKVTP